MDDSEVFIKQCDHEKIQGGWKPKVGDWTDKGIIVKMITSYAGTSIVVYHSHQTKAYDKSQLIFKPRQDQLWEMLPQIKEHDWILQRYVSGGKRGWCVACGYSLEEYLADTPEQALIQGVMHQHGLRWDGEWS